MNESVRLNLPIEFINIAPVNPLISRCEIKVCWVGETPNRNKSIITKEVAKEMANSLPGSPIVGFYNEEKQDFEAHNFELCLKDGKVEFKVTRCTVCEACKKAGLTDIGYHVYCMTDPAVVSGINPEIKFERTHTLMQGDAYCDHCYRCDAKK